MKYYIVLITSQILIFFTSILHAQDENHSTVQFHGSNTLFGQYATRQGVNSEIPPSFFRNDLQMTLSIYDIPVSASFFITSEQRDYRQSINNFRIYFDFQAMAINKAKTLAMNKAKGLANEKLPWMMRFMGNFPTLEIGKCRPNYSDLTLKGIPVSGVNIEFTPGPLYSAFCTGKTLRPVKIKPDSLVIPVYEQKILFGKLGFGKKQGTHFYLTYMQVKDNVNSLPVPSPSEPDTTHILSPKSNYVIGSELKLAFFQKKFTIEGEGAVSLLTRDTQSLAIDLEDSDVPAWATDFFKPNISSSVDYAYDVEANLKLNTTKITGGMRMVGAVFTTLGNPNLVNDRLTYHGKIDQTFAKKQVSLSVYYKHHNDNLIHWKKATSTMISYGITVGFRFKKVPYLIVSYMPNLQETENDSMILKNSVRVITATTGHNYKIGKLRSNTSFSLFYQDTESEIDTIASRTINTTYTLNEMLSFTIPLSIAAGASYIHSEYSLQKRDILMLTLSGSLSAFESKWQNSLGVKYSNQDEQQQKIGFFWNSRVKLWNGGDLSIRIEDNIFSDICHKTDDFSEFIAQLTFEVRW